jgi:hypothetical protein
MSRKFIVSLNTFVFILVLGVTSNPFALDDTSSLECDGGIVVRGDSADSVREKCGDPQKILRPDPQEPAVWVYNFGTTEFSYLVSIVNGNVERIQMGDYGK